MFHSSNKEDFFLFLPMYQTTFLYNYQSINYLYLHIYISTFPAVFLPTSCLSTYPSSCLPICLPTHPSNLLPIYQTILISTYHTYVSINLPSFLSTFLPIATSLPTELSSYPSPIYLSTFSSIHMSIYPSLYIHLSLCILW